MNLSTYTNFSCIMSWNLSTHTIYSTGTSLYWKYKKWKKYFIDPLNHINRDFSILISVYYFFNISFHLYFSELYFFDFYFFISIDIDDSFFWNFYIFVNENNFFNWSLSILFDIYNFFYCFNTLNEIKLIFKYDFFNINFNLLNFF